MWFEAEVPLEEADFEAAACPDACECDECVEAAILSERLARDD
jgi:hypothetical protein